MNTPTIHSILLLTGAWLLGTSVTLAEVIQPTTTPAPLTWVDTAPTEPVAQYDRYAKKVGSADTIAVLKWERIALHDTKNYPVYVSDGVMTSPWGGAASNNKPIAGFDGTTNLLGTDSSRSNQTFSKDLAVYVQNKPKLYKKTPFSSDLNYSWRRVEGGTLTTSEDFFTMTSNLDVNAGTLKKTYPHPIRNAGEVAVNDLIVLSGRVHFVTPKGAVTKPIPITATFTFALDTPTKSSQELTTVRGCSNRSFAMKLPVIPVGALADLRDWTVVEDTSPAAAARCK